MGPKWKMGPEVENRIRPEEIGKTLRGAVSKRDQLKARPDRPSRRVLGGEI
jgi:hypothetical protein